jgi:SH3-like domain-containing protein
MKTLAHWLRVLVVAVWAIGTVAPLSAQEIAAGPAVGPETNLPLPRFVSLRASEANVRRGPSLSHRIDWVFKRRDMPLQIVAEYGHWRRVIDRDGQGGWVHFRMLSGARTAIVMGEGQVPMRSRPDPAATETAMLEPGVIGRLDECDPDWCQIVAGGFRGWVQRGSLWGIGEDELRD